MKFEIVMIWPGVYLVTVSTGEVLGIFGSAEEVEAACKRYIESLR